MHAYEVHAYRMHACGVHGCERGPRERYVHAIHIPAAPYYPREEEQLGPFYQLLEGSAGISEVSDSEV
jgi:hypothetical protein